MFSWREARDEKWKVSRRIKPLQSCRRVPRQCLVVWNESAGHDLDRETNTSPAQSLPSFTSALNSAAPNGSQRYLVICYPLRSREKRTPKNAVTSICLVWALALVFSAPYLSNFSQMDLAGTVVCIPAWESKPRLIMDVCTFVFGYLVPVLVLGLTYARTIRYLWTSVDPVKDMSESRRAKRKVTKMIIIVAALFCICWMPHHLVILCMWFRCFPLNHTTYILRILSHLVAYTNSCLNPIVDALVSKHFRKGFRKVLCCSLKRREVNKVHMVQAVNTISSVETNN